MKTGKVSNDPFAVVEFPVKRCAPVFAVDGLPAFRKPPAKVFVTTVVNELKEIPIADRSFIDREVPKKHLVCRLFVVEGKLQGTCFGLRVLLFVFVEPNQSTFSFRNPIKLHGR